MGGTLLLPPWLTALHVACARFDLLFRKSPFGGEYTVFAGLEECIRYAANFRFTPADLTYLRTVLPATTEVSPSPKERPPCLFTCPKGVAHV